MSLEPAAAALAGIVVLAGVPHLGAVAGDGLRRRSPPSAPPAPPAPSRRRPTDPPASVRPAGPLGSAADRQLRGYGRFGSDVFSRVSGRRARPVRVRSGWPPIGIYAGTAGSGRRRLPGFWPPGTPGCGFAVVTTDRHLRGYGRLGSPSSPGFPVRPGQAEKNPRKYFSEVSTWRANTGFWAPECRCPVLGLTHDHQPGTRLPDRGVVCAGRASPRDPAARDGAARAGRAVGDHAPRRVHRPRRDRARHRGRARDRRGRCTPRGGVLRRRARPRARHVHRRRSHLPG